MPKNDVAYSYEIYIGAPVAQVWKGIVDGEMTKHYVYGTRFESKLTKGSPYAYVGDGGFKVVDGEILEVEPEKRLEMLISGRAEVSCRRKIQKRGIVQVGSQRRA